METSSNNYVKKNATNFDDLSCSSGSFEDQLTKSNNTGANPEIEEQKYAQPSMRLDFNFDPCPKTEIVLDVEDKTIVQDFTQLKQ